jgi:hypothetical protein
MTPKTQEGRPASRPTAQNVPSPGSRSAAQPTPLTGPPMLPVAEHLIGKGRQLGPVPQYASPEWPARPVGSPRWLAAVLGAAEAWRTWTDPAEVARRLRVEIDAAGRDDEAGAGSHAPACHLDGRPVRYRAPLQAVPDPQDGGVA